MITMFANFFAMFAALFEAGRNVAESGNDFSKLGRVKSMTMLRDELAASGDLKQLRAELEELGLAEAISKPTPRPITKATK